MAEKPEEGFKSRLDDVFSGLDGVGFKSDSSLIQKPYKATAGDLDDDFRRPRSPGTRRSSEQQDRRSSSSGTCSSGNRDRSFDKFKKTDSIFQESQDVGGWRKKDFKPPALPSSNHRSLSSSSSRRPHHNDLNTSSGGHHANRRPKNPMFDHRRPQHKDPKKYTKYSLADVKDVTDKSNAQAALAFLHDRKRKSTEAAKANDDDDEGFDREGEARSSSEKVVFKKPKKHDTIKESSSSSLTTSDFGLSCGNSKRVMPEAVVGQTKAKKATGSKVKLASSSDSAGSNTSSKKQNKLSHLSFDDEEEEEED